jgi:hypothetical protein
MAEKAAPAAPKVAEAPQAAAPRFAGADKPGTRTPAVAEMPLGATAEQFCFTTFADDNGLGPEDDLEFSSGDLDSVLASMTDQERETFLKTLKQRKKDGSCLESSLLLYLA